MRTLALLLTLASVSHGCKATRAAPPAGAEGTAEAAAGYDGGFFLRSPDGRNELVIEGLLQTVLVVRDGGREPDSSVELKRIRPEFGGRVDEVVRFKLEPKFQEDEVELEEAWLGFDCLGGDALAMFGRMKAPFGLEEVRSRRHIDFPRFSILNQFSPAERHGAFLNGKAAGGRLEYGLAAYDGTGASEGNTGKEVAARVMVHPFLGDSESPWRNLQLGVGATVGRQDADVGGGAVENALGLPVVVFAQGVALDGRRRRVGPEAAWFHGPWFVQAEALAMAQEMSLAGAEQDVAFSGAYLTVARVLTGEDKTFAGVVPREPYDLSAGAGTGAWVLALRLSELRVDGDAAGFAAPGAFTDRIRSASLGLNWIPNRHLILRNALVYSAYEDDVALDTGSADSELGLLVELQLHF
jgi:phosphate-selective porin OprO/OprP